MKTRLSRLRRARAAARRPLRLGTKRSIGAAQRQLPAAIKNILVPIDFSPASLKALAYAVPFAQQFNAKLTILHVVEPSGTPDFMKSFPLALENDKVMVACHTRLKALIKREAIAPKLVVKTLVRYGRSFHEIASAARNLHADLIIISTHGYTGLKHVVLGSTTERVVRHAPCPVLAVRARTGPM